MMEAYWAKRVKNMKLAAVLLLLSFAPFANAQCTELLNSEKELSKNLPKQIDEYTTLTEVSVNCTNRIVKYVKHFSVSGSVLADGPKKESSDNIAICTAISRV